LHYSPSDELDSTDIAPGIATPSVCCFLSLNANDTSAPLISTWPIWTPTWLAHFSKALKSSGTALPVHVMIAADPIPRTAQVTVSRCRHGRHWLTQSQQLDIGLI